MADGRTELTGALGGYLDALAAPSAEVRRVMEDNRDDPGAVMMTHPELGRLLAVLVAASGGRRVLEVGTYLGISATWIAQALAGDGRLDTLEADAGRADRAERWFARAGLADRVRVLRGPAADTLPGLPDGAYDLCYIDADKPGYLGYLDHAVRLVRPGGFVVADNILYGGEVVAARPGPEAAALLEFTRTAIDHPRLRTVALGIGDGITLSVVRDAPGGG